MCEPAPKRARRATADVPPVLGPLPRDTELVAKLERDGYAVVENVLTLEQCDHAENLAWEWLKKVAPNVERHDPKSWNTKNLPPLTGGLTKGLWQFFGVGWGAGDVYVRDIVKSVFARIYGTNRLWTSFGGFSASMRPADSRCAWKSSQDFEERKWDSAIHTDQTRMSDTHLCYQSGVAITDQPADGHVFVCVPGSHAYHAELLKRGEAKIKKLHWQEMTPVQKEYMRSVGLDVVRVPLRRGSMVLWDSRTIHSNSGYFATSAPETRRMQMLICMAPAPAPGSKLHEQESRLRKEAYAKAITSKHTPIPARLFTSQRTWGKVVPASPAPPVLSPEQRQLHGLDAYGDDVV